MELKEINIKIHPKRDGEEQRITIEKPEEIATAPNPPSQEENPQKESPEKESAAPTPHKSGKIPQYPDMKQSKLYYALNVIVITSVLLIGAVITLFYQRPDYSESEKRELAAMPEFSLKGYFDGSFMTGLSLFFADTMPFREPLVELGSYIREGFGIRIDNVAFHGVVSAQPEVTEPPLPEITDTLPAVTDEGDTPEATVQSEPAQTLSPEQENQNIEFANNGIVIVGDRGLMLFGGNKTEGRHYANVLNTYKKELGEDVNLYCLVTPTAVEFYLPSKYSQYSSGEKEFIDDIYANLDGVTGIDAYSKLAAHINEDIYLKTDHHWSQLGSYYAYTAFAEALGEEATPLSEYEQKVKEGFVGSLYGYTNDITLKNNPEDFYYYIQPDSYTTYYYRYDTLSLIGAGPLYYESASGANMYSMFLGQDAIHTKIVSENKNGRKIAVFKDSFGNAFVTHLMRHFEEVYVIDIRYFGMGAVDYLKQVGITDVIFVNNIFAANTNSLISRIETLLTGPVGVTTAPVTESLPPETDMSEPVIPSEETTPATTETAAPEVTETPPPVESETDTSPVGSELPPPA